MPKSPGLLFGGRARPAAAGSSQRAQFGAHRAQRWLPPLASLNWVQTGRLDPTGPAVPPQPRARPRTAAGRAKLASARLAEEYPGTAKELCELDFSTPWQLLVATVLSAQTTDERVNSVTPALFARYPMPPELAAADPADVELLIRPTGFFRVKSKTLVALAQALCDKYAGEVPTALEDLVTLPGVGRKTGNVVRSVAFDLPGFPVDTHVGRISRLLVLTKQKDPDRVEAEVCAMLPSREWGPLSLRLILHGRRICIARRPRCPECILSDFCPSAILPLGQARSRVRL
jgi:endonuclease III